MKQLSSIILLISLFLTTSAQAYVLPTEFIMRMLADKQRRLKAQDWSLKLSTEFVERSEVVEERLYLKRPERVRRVQTTNGHEVYVEFEGKTATGTTESLVPSKEAITNLVGSLMLPKGKTLDEMSIRMMENLQKVGIDTTQVAIGRLGQRPVYIIGAKAFERDKPQVWFDKASFLPVHWLVYTQGKNAGDKIEMTLKDYNSSPAGSSYPQVIDTYRNGKLVSRSNVMEAKKNQSLPESLFKLQ